MYELNMPAITTVQETTADATACNGINIHSWSNVPVNGKYYLMYSIIKTIISKSNLISNL